jgi:dienelactone hydrolase
MIPVNLCLAGRDLTEPVPSPDGKWVLVGVRSAGRSGLLLVPSDGGPERLLSVDPVPAHGRGLGGGCSDWLPDSSGFVYAAADGQVWIHLLDGQRRALTSLAPGHEVSCPAVSPDGAQIAFVIDLAEVHVVMLDDPATDRSLGALSDFVIDPAWSPDGRELTWHAWDVPNMAWDESYVVRCAVDPRDAVLVADRVAQQQVQQPRYSADGALWDVCDADGWLNVRRNGRVVVAEAHEHAGPTWGPGQRSFAVSPDGRRVVLNRNEAGFGRLVLVDLGDGTAAPIVSEVAKGVHGQIRWVGDRVTALRTGGRTPTQVVVYDTGADSGVWSRTTLAVGPVAEWSNVEEHLVEPELFEVSTYQGARVPVRAYRPVDPDARASGRMICWVHGGPTDQWQVTFMPRITYWVSRGWTVLVPDHRGSTGHGRAFQQAMRNAWGTADAQDVSAAVAYAQALGWGSRARTVLMGGSAGGYTALNVLVAHPELVAGAAVVYPVTDPVVLAAATYRFEAHYNDTLLGAEPVVVDPLRLQRPVLVLHGDADPVVPVVQSELFVERAAAAGKDVELHVFEGEGHGFRLPANQAAEYALIEAFVSRIVS